MVAAGRNGAGGQATRSAIERIGLALTVSADTLEGPELRWNASQLPVIDPASYDIQGEVGQGGIGRVLRATDTRLHRPVALKELLEAGGSAAEERFVREALLTARLQHPSIVPLYEAGRWPTGAPFYAMKLVSGRSLLDILGESRTLDARLGLLPHALAACEAMAYAHSERIIHRDLKPGNVLVGAFGETVVIDWGLAKDLSVAEPDPVVGPPVQIAPESTVTSSPPTPDPRPPSGNTPRGRTPSGRTPSGRTPPGEALTLHGAVIGTPAYMPPEQARGEPVDERADVYSLGGILYHLLTGTCPYDGRSGASVLRKVLAGPPVPAGERQPGIPEDLLAIVNKAMAREPADRYPSAKELADDLRRFQTGQIVAAHRYSRGELVRRFARRYRAALSVAAAALAVIAISGAFAVRQIMAESRLARERQAEAEEAERRALDHADDLTLVQARTAVERDPNKALAWLKTLSDRFTRWPEARLVAADARGRGISTVLRGHEGNINAQVFSRDGRWLVTASDDHTMRMWDLAGLSPGEGRAAVKGVASRVFEGHTDEVWGATLSPDGARIVTAGKDRTLRLWDRNTGSSRVIDSGHATPIAEVAFVRPDLLISASDDGTARLWDVKTGELRGVLGAPGLLRTVAVSDDGRFVAAGGYDKKLHVWDVATLTERVLSGHDGEVAGVAISPDSKSIATRDRQGMVRLWDAETGGSRVLSPPLGKGTFTLAPFGKIRFSPDGERLAIAGDGPFVRLWDVASGRERRLDGPDGKTNWVAFSPDSTLVAAASQDHMAHLWNVEGGPSRPFTGFEGEVTTVAFSPDGKLLSAAGVDGSLRLFPVAAAESRALEAGAALWSVGISADQARLLAAGDDGRVFVWDLGSGARTALEGHRGPVYTATFSPDGQLVVSGGTDGTTRLWTLEGHELWSAPGRGPEAISVVFSPDGRLVASPGRSGGVQVIDVDSGAVRELPGDGNPLVWAGFSPDGARVSGAGKAGSLHVWDLATGQDRRLIGHELAVFTSVFSPDGRTLATGAFDHTLRLWDLATGESRKSDSGGGGISQIVFSADASTLYTCDTYEARVRLWDLPAGSLRTSLAGHRGFVTRLALSPDERRLATASQDRTVRLWDLGSGAARVLRGHTGPVNDVTFSPDGKLVASTSSDGTVRLWPDDLPHDPAALRAWIHEATPDTIAAADRRDPAAGK